MKLNYRFLIYLSFFSLACFFLVFKTIDVSLKKYTRHHDIIHVPSLVGLSLLSAQDTLVKKKLTFTIIDSTAYNPQYTRGAVIDHTPKAGSSVKPGRKIYLTMNPLTIHYVPLPDLKNKSLRQAISVLESHAFRIGNLYYVDYFAKDVIRFFKVNGDVVNVNDSLPKFTIVDLYVGDGQEKTVSVPDISGLPFSQIKRKLNNYSLNLGFCHFNTHISDTLKSVIYKQEPLADTKAPLGSYVKVWFKDSLN